MNPMTLIIVAGVFVLTILRVLGKVDDVYILPILGAVCVLMGVVALVQGSRREKGMRTSDRQKALLFIILGAVLFVFGAIEILGIEFSEMTSTGVMGLLLVLIITYFVIRVTRR